MQVAAKIAEFKAALSSSTEMLGLQQRIIGEADFSRVCQGMIDSLLAKAASIPCISPEQVTELSDVIQVSVFSDEQKSRLVTALASRCLPTDESENVLTRATQTQAMLNPDKFLTMNDWNILQDGHKSIIQKSTAVALRMRCIGCCNPSEASIKAMAGIIISCHCPDGTPDQWFSIAREVKTAFVSLRQESVGCAKLATYPDHPDVLPQLVYFAGYTDKDDPPAGLTIPGMAALIARIPMRITHRAVRGAHGPGAGVVAPSHMPWMSRPMAAGSQGADFLSLMATMLSNPMLPQFQAIQQQQLLLQQQQQQQQQQNPLLTILGPGVRPAAPGTPGSPLLQDSEDGSQQVGLADSPPSGQSPAGLSRSSSSIFRSIAGPVGADVAAFGRPVGTVGAAIAGPVGAAAALPAIAGPGGADAFAAAGAAAGSASAGTVDKMLALAHGGQLAQRELDAAAEEEADAAAEEEGAASMLKRPAASMLKRPAASMLKRSAAAAKEEVAEDAAEGRKHDGKLKLVLGCGRCRGYSM